MVHPHTQQQFINEEIGYGVVATRLIPRGTITWVRDAFDQVISAVKVERIAPIYRDIVVKYCFVDAKGDFVLCWDLARYVNHSCDPNCRSAGYDFELTVRDIQPGEELTDDYGSLNPEYDFTCRCGSALCRKQIRPGDLLRYADVWDRAVEEPFRLISKLPQPLWPLIEEKDVITAVLAHGLPIASCRKNYYGGPMPSLARPGVPRSV